MKANVKYRFCSLAFVLILTGLLFVCTAQADELSVIMNRAINSSVTSRVLLPGTDEQPEDPDALLCRFTLSDTEAFLQYATNKNGKLVVVASDPDTDEVLFRVEKAVSETEELQQTTLSLNKNIHDLRAVYTAWVEDEEGNMISASLSDYSHYAKPSQVSLLSSAELTALGDRYIPLFSVAGNVGYTTIKPDVPLFKSASSDIGILQDGYTYTFTRGSATTDEDWAMLTGLEKNEAFVFVDDLGRSFYSVDSAEGMMQSGEDDSQYIRYFFLQMDQKTISADGNTVTLYCDDEFENGSLASIVINGVPFDVNTHLNSDPFPGLSGHLSMEADICAQGVLTLHYSSILGVPEAMYTKLDMTYEFKNMTFKVDAAFNATYKAVPLFSVGIPFVADIEVIIGLALDFDAAGEIVYDMQGRFGCWCDWDILHGGKGDSYNNGMQACMTKLDIEGSVSVGITLSLEVEFLGYSLEAGIDAYGCLKLTGKVCGNEVDEETGRWHECDTLKCLRGDMSLGCGIGASVSMMHMVLWKYEFASTETKIGDFYHSWDYDDSSWLQSDCPHQSGIVHIRAQDANGSPLTAFSASYTGTQNTRYTQRTPVKNSGTTAGNELSLFFPLEKDTIFEADVAWTDSDGNVLHGTAQFTAPQSDTDHETTVKVTVDNRKFILGFDQNYAGTVENMPAEVTFYAGRMSALPDREPKASGHRFMGWSTQSGPDAQVEYTPGAGIVLSGNTTLYAVWQVLGQNEYIVTYHAEGASGCPQKQVWSTGADVTIATDAPVKHGYTFLGWSADEAADTPEYLPGQIISGGFEGYTTLYAVWQYDPVIALRIHYDAGYGKNAPADQFTTAQKALRIRETRPIWESHAFLGWSRTPGATVGEYMPGLRYAFTGSTTLYAVWQAEYVILEGDGAIWYRNVGAPLRLCASGATEDFVSLQIDGKRVPAEAYIVSSGSTVIHLNGDWIGQELEDGVHSFRFIYRDDATGVKTFTIQDHPDHPRTGDTAVPELWACVVMLSVAAAATLFAYGKYKR